mmetsp:Transcript_39199/g.100178  ORF Transcript_39199/g.100178 Transcript_39199/m.100178 type:complete len:339 (-) Transcript_39199:53-1069(-)
MLCKGLPTCLLPRNTLNDTCCAPLYSGGSYILHWALLLGLPAPAHLATLSLHAHGAGRPEDLHLDLVTDFVDFRIHGEHHGAQHAVAGESVVEEVDKEHDLDDAANPRLDVRVVRHLDLLVDPVQGVEDPVTAERNHIKAGAPIPAAFIAVAKNVLWHHSEALNELRKRPQNLQDGILIGEKDGGSGAREDDDCQIASVVPTFVSFVELIEQNENDDGCSNVRQLEEDEVSRLRMVKQVQIPRDKNQEIHELCAARNACNRLIFRDGHQKHNDSCQVQVVTDVTEDVPRVGSKICKICGAMKLVHRIHSNGGRLHHSLRGFTHFGRRSTTRSSKGCKD